ncbi:MAG TPA: dTDP-4-dehydrorhamnose reductase, partial [Hellea balneolensis]|nr:dTDP-4-dehydrorhamnose reductase [Hellea balneolensis]
EFKARYWGRDTLDLSAPAKTITAVLDKHPRPDLIINTAAYTHVDKAEDEPKICAAINSTAVNTIAGYCTQNAIPLLHISTDYVFNGRATTPYKPGDQPDPICTYGVTKLAGEMAVLQSKCYGAILRTSWVYDGVGQNFFTTISKLARNRDTFHIVCDQTGRPTLSDDLALALISVVRFFKQHPNTPAKIYHVSGSGPETNWYEFAKAFLGAQYGNQKCITPIPTSAYPTKAKRPAYSVLDISEFEQNFTHTLPDWRDGLVTALEQWAGQGNT